MILTSLKMSLKMVPPQSCVQLQLVFFSGPLTVAISCMCTLIIHSLEEPSDDSAFTVRHSSCAHLWSAYFAYKISGPFVFVSVLLPDNTVAYSKNPLSKQRLHYF